MSSHPRIAEQLVETGAYQDLDTPVILVSGQLGTYYINAEKLARDGGEFNKYGDDSHAMIQHACRMADEHPPFREVIDIIAEDVDVCFGRVAGRFFTSVVSGGQRRDWLFSGPVAKRLGLPHISCYKDGHLYMISPDTQTTSDDIEDFEIVHVADLITTGSSAYDARKTSPTGWIPMLRSQGAHISDLLAVVSRLQGGEENLRAASVDARSYVQIDEEFLGRYSRQPDVAIAYIRDPRGWSEQYLGEQGVEPFVAAFGPKKKDDRGVRFLAVYERVLRESGRWDELAARVQREHGVDINSLSYRDIKTVEE